MLPLDGPALLCTPGDVLLPFGAGSESVALQSVRQQAAAGLTLLRILQMATLNAAEVLGRTDSTGALEPGKDDIVLLANPLAGPLARHRRGGPGRSGKVTMMESIAEAHSAV